MHKVETELREARESVASLRQAKVGLHFFAR